MAKILNWTDHHLHPHKDSEKRLLDGVAVLRWVFDTALERNIKHLVFGGDLFQDRKKIFIRTYDLVFNVIYEYMTKSDLNLYLLVGNHDMWFNDQWDISSISPLRAIRGVQIIDRCCKVDVGGLDVDFLPYVHDPVEAAEKHFRRKSPVMVGHIAVDGARLHAKYNTKAEVSVEHDGDMKKVGVDVFSGWKRVLLGHYHMAQKLNDRVEYMGSPMELNFGEAFQPKHLVVLDQNDLSLEYIANTFSPKHLIIKQDEVDRYSLEGNYVQILVEDIGCADVIDLKKSISKGVSSLEFKEERKEKTVTATKVDLRQGDALERWVRASKVTLDITKLLDIGNRICQDV